MALGNLLSCDTALPCLSRPDKKGVLADDVRLLSKMIADQLLLTGYELVPSSKSGTQGIVVDRGSLSVQATRMRVP